MTSRQNGHVCSCHTEMWKLRAENLSSWWTVTSPVMVIICQAVDLPISKKQDGFHIPSGMLVFRQTKKVSSLSRYLQYIWQVGASTQPASLCASGKYSTREPMLISYPDYLPFHQGCCWAPHEQSLVCKLHEPHLRWFEKFHIEYSLPTSFHCNLWNGMI